MWSSALRWIAAAVTIGLLLGALGPFGSYMNGGLAGRVGYWIAATLIGLVFYLPALKAATRLAPPGTVARWPTLIAAVLIASVPEALITWTIALWLWPGLARFGPSALVWFGQTATIGLLATLGAVFALHRAAAMPRDSVELAPVVPMLTDPLPVDVLALQMEDHYVRVHTPHGSTLMLMPLGSAIAGVTAEGLRTHRSWWVARHAVTAVEGTPRAMRVRLSNGLVAPVSRSAIIHLKSAGWIVA